MAEQNSFYTTTLTLNAALSSKYKSTFAAGVKTNERWTDSMASLQQQAAGMTALTGLADDIQELSSQEVLSDDQKNELAYLQNEYASLAQELGVAGKSYVELKKEAAKLTSEFDKQAIAMKDVAELNQDIANVEQIIALEKEVKRLNEQYKATPSKQLEKDLKEQTKQLERLKRMAGLTGDGVVNLTEHYDALRAELEKQVKQQEELEKQQKATADAAEKAAKKAANSKEKWEQLGAISEKVRGGFAFMASGIAKAAAAASAAAGVVAAMTNSTAERLNELAVRSNQFGSSTKSIQEWSYFMQKGGLEYDQVIDGFQTLQERMVEASKEPGEMRDNFKKLGISLEDLKKGNVDDVLAKITNNVHMLGSEAEITKWGLDMLGGEGGKMLAQAAKGGTKGFQEAQKEAAKSGNVASEAAIKTAQEYTEAKHKIQMAWQGIVTQITTKVMPVMVELFNKVSKWVEENQDKVQEWGDKFAEYAQKLPGMFQNLLDVVKQIPEWFDKAKKFIEDWGPLIGILTGLVAILSVIPPIVAAINIVLAANPVVLIIMAIIVGIGILAAVIWAFRDEIAAFFKSVWEWMKGAWDWIKKIAGIIGDALVSAWNSAVEAFNSGKEWVMEMFDSISTKISGVVDNIISWFKGIPDAIKSAFTGAVDTVKGTVNDVIGFMNGMDFKVPDWVPKFGGKTFGFNIPMLANGGIATQPTLAMVGEGREDEAILPLSKLDALLRGSQSKLGGGSQGITFQITQKIELNAANSDVESEARRGAAQGAQDLAREIERIMREKQRLAF